MFTLRTDVAEGWKSELMHNTEYWKHFHPFTHGFTKHFYSLRGCTDTSNLNNSITKNSWDKALEHTDVLNHADASLSSSFAITYYVHMYKHIQDQPMNEKFDNMKPTQFPVWKKKKNTAEPVTISMAHTVWRGAGVCGTNTLFWQRAKRRTCYWDGELPLR